MGRIVLTHYYAEGCTPLLNLLKLGEEDRARLVEDLSRNEGKAYGRFRNPDWYLLRRAAMEKWMHEEFIRLGGRPRTPHPLYFIVGESAFLRTCVGDNCRQITVALDDIPEDTVSFTLGDSLSLYVSETEKKLYTKRMFLELPDMDGSGRQCDNERNFTEAQIWQDHL